MKHWIGEGGLGLLLVERVLELAEPGLVLLPQGHVPQPGLAIPDVDQHLLTNKHGRVTLALGTTRLTLRGSIIARWQPLRFKDLFVLRV